MPGGTSALASSTWSVATHTKVPAISTKKTGKTPRQPMVERNGMAASAVPPTMYEDAALPTPLKPCAKLRLRP